MLYRALEGMGLSSAEFGLHSLRICAVSVAANIGLPHDVIQCIDCWHSTAYKFYIRK